MDSNQADTGALASQLYEMVKRAEMRRYRPINARDDIVEFSGCALDRLYAGLAQIVKRSEE